MADHPPRYSLATPSITFPVSSSAAHSVKTSTIVGATVGCAAAFLISLGLLAFFLRRRRKAQENKASIELSGTPYPYSDNFPSTTQAYDLQSVPMDSSISPTRTMAGSASDSFEAGPGSDVSMRKSRFGIGARVLGSESIAGSTDHLQSPNSDTSANTTEVFQSVEALRREVARLREEQIWNSPELPPQYDQLGNPAHI